MDRDLKDKYESLYNTDLRHLEKNLLKFIEAKHEHSKQKQKEHFENE